MSMNDLLIECQNKVAQLEAERDKLAAALYEANNKLDDVRDSFCGKNLMISGWHLNGDLEPVDNWFDSNDWEPVPESEKLVDNIRAKSGKDGFIAGVLYVNPTAEGRERLTDEANEYADSIRQTAKDGE